MAKCRLQNLKPPCGYNLEGLEAIQLLDFEDFKGFQFENDGTYASCLVSAVLRIAPFIDLKTPNTAKYSSAVSNKIYAHTLETFIDDLSASTLQNLNLGLHRRFLPVFQLKTGKLFTFGYEAGASLNYTAQTAESTGTLVTITAASTYPLFEVLPAALSKSYISEYTPDFNVGAYCQTI